MGITTHPLDTPLGYALKLTRILLGEGIGLFVAFSSLLNYKRFGLLIGFNDVNSWSLLDEHCHVRNNIKVLHEVILELSPQDRLALIAETKKMVDDYVEVEHSLVDLLGGNEGITSEQHKDYISYLGKLRLFEIGYIGKLEVPENPMPWMDSMLGAERHGAFFEKRITDYSHRKLEGVVNYTKYQTLLS
jgi:ribonucleotide reductase beta subunit family protein with ferritin-like domain